MRVAIAHHDGDGQSKLGRLLEACGLDVVLNTAFAPNLPDQLSRNKADVLLVDLEDGEVLQKEYLDTLFEQLDMPIVFSDNDVTIKNGQTEEELGRQLSNKLTSLFSRGGRVGKGKARPGNPAQGLDSVGLHDAGNEGLQQGGDVVVSRKSGKDEVPAYRVWVLTGSIGGLEAIKRFLSALPGDLPVAFIVAQHISENLVAQASRLIDAVTSFHVQPAQVGHIISDHDVIMLPVVDESLFIDNHGQIGLVPPVSAGEISLTIDSMLNMVAKRYGRNAGAIVFSGIGRAGIDGCRAIIDHGGVVWTQDAESSRFASMPQYIRDACKVSFTATPELLAKQLAEDLYTFELKRANTHAG